MAGVIAKINKGELSPVMEEPGTFMILRVDDIQHTDPKPFESVKEIVKMSLLEELAREKIENRLSQLREAADIQKMGAVYERSGMSRGKAGLCDARRQEAWKPSRSFVEAPGCLCKKQPVQRQ